MAIMDMRTPPRFVPTLTDVVAEANLSTPALEMTDTRDLAVDQPASAVAPEMSTQRCVADVETNISAQEMAVIAQSLQEKVMARLDESLQERMRYALADLVQLHTQALYRAIRQDLEHLVSASVHEAIAQELASMRARPKN